MGGNIYDVWWVCNLVCGVGGVVILSLWGVGGYCYNVYISVIRSEGMIVDMPPISFIFFKLSKVSIMND